VSRLRTSADLEQFLLNHGEQVIDGLAVEVDRIERNVKVRSSHITQLKDKTDTAYITGRRQILTAVMLTWRSYSG
jgi:hypothetical protein